MKAALDAGEPTISVDTKKKELAGDFKNAGWDITSPKIRRAEFVANWRANTGLPVLESAEP